MGSLSVPHELTELEREAIVTHLKGLGDAEGEELRSFEFTLPDRPPFFVKQSDDILAEASTQTFFHLLAISDKSAPQIPKVFDAFSSEEGYCFMVMEKIAAPTLSDCDILEEEAVEYAASAVKWLLNQLPFVPASSFGTILSEPQAAPVWHQFFKEHRALRVFAGPDELIIYVLKASGSCRPGARLSPSVETKLLTSFKENRHIYHSDIKKENFLLDSNKKVWINDFQHVGVLPQEFQTYPFFNINKDFAARVGKKTRLSAFEHCRSDGADLELTSAAWRECLPG